MDVVKQDEKNVDKVVAVCSSCRHHQHNPCLEFNFTDAKIYYLCMQCSTMNVMDVSKPLPPKYPKTRGI